MIGSVCIKARAALGWKQAWEIKGFYHFLPLLHTFQMQRLIPLQLESSDKPPGLNRYFVLAVVLGENLVVS